MPKNVHYRIFANVIVALKIDRIKVTKMNNTPAKLSQKCEGVRFSINQDPTLTFKSPEKELFLLFHMNS